MILLEISFPGHYFFVAVQKSSNPHPTRGLTLFPARVRGGWRGWGLAGQLVPHCLKAFGSSRNELRKSEGLLFTDSCYEISLRFPNMW